MKRLVLIAHNLRSCNNVGSILRTADGLGVERVFLTGYTPYPLQDNDNRLPHMARKTHKQISKTALGAEDAVNWSFTPDIFSVIDSLRADNFQIIAIEQGKESIELPDLKSSEKIALIVGREVEGVEQEVLSACDKVVEIPMFGSKESYNVAHAAAMALYHCKFYA